MIAILTQSLTYLIVIVIAYALKGMGVLKTEDSKVLSAVSVNITLPALVISSFRAFEIKSEFIIIVILGFVINIILLIGSLVLTKRRERKDRIMIAFNNSSYNLGSFALPYINAFYQPAVALYVVMFDIGNAIYSMGVNNAVITTYLGKDRHNGFDIKIFFKTLCKSRPFMTYIVMIIISLLKVPLPESFFTITSTIGHANIIIVMVMFGLMFELPKQKYIIKDSTRILLTRYISSGLMIVLVFLLPFLSMEVKQVITLSLLSPMSSIIPSFCMEHECDEHVYGFISSLSIIISIVFLTIAITLFTVI